MRSWLIWWYYHFLSTCVSGSLCSLTITCQSRNINSICTDEKTETHEINDLSKVVWPLRCGVGIHTGQYDNSGLVTHPGHWELLESGKRGASKATVRSGSSEPQKEPPDISQCHLYEKEPVQTDPQIHQPSQIQDNWSLHFISSFQGRKSEANFFKIIKRCE